MKREGDLLLRKSTWAWVSSAFSWNGQGCCSHHPSLPHTRCSVRGETFHFVLGRHWTQLDNETQEIWHHLLPAMFWLQYLMSGHQLLPECAWSCEASRSGNTFTKTFLNGIIHPGQAACWVLFFFPFLASRVTHLFLLSMFSRENIYTWICTAS